MVDSSDLYKEIIFTYNNNWWYNNLNQILENIKSFIKIQIEFWWNIDIIKIVKNNIGELLKERYWNLFHKNI